MHPKSKSRDVEKAKQKPAKSYFIHSNHTIFHTQMLFYNNKKNDCNFSFVNEITDGRKIKTKDPGHDYALLATASR